jgi:hypothetical protein
MKNACLLCVCLSTVQVCYSNLALVLRVQFNWYNACLASEKAWLQTPVLKNSFKAVFRGPETYTYKPSYPGGGDQEDSRSRPAQAKSSQDPISKTAMCDDTQLLSMWLWEA